MITTMKLYIYIYYKKKKMKRYFNYIYTCTTIAWHVTSHRISSPRMSGASFRIAMTDANALKKSTGPNGTTTARAACDANPMFTITPRTMMMLNAARAGDRFHRNGFSE